MNGSQMIKAHNRVSHPAKGSLLPSNWVKTKLCLVACLSFSFLANSLSPTYAQPSNDQSLESNKQFEQTKEQVKSQTQPSPKINKRALVESKIIEIKLRLESSPNDQKLLATLAKLYIKLGDYPNALTHLKTNLELNDQNEDIHYLTAFTLRKLKRYQDAVVYYQKFLKIAQDPKRLSGVFGLAKTLDLMGDPKGAYELYQEFADQESRPNQKRWVEEAKSSMRRLQASEVVLVDTDTNEDKPTVQEQEVKSIKTIKESLSAVLARADQFFVKQQYQDASRLYLEISERALPKNIRLKVIYSAAVCNYLLANFKDAKALAEKALAIDNHSPSLKGLAVLSHIQYRESQERKLNDRQALAQIRLAMKEGRLHNALAQINTHLKQSKESISPSFLHAKGQVHLRLGNYSAAYQALKQASKGLNYPHLHLDLARTANALSQTKRAREHYNDLIKLLNKSELSAQSQLSRRVSQELKALNN